MTKQEIIKSCTQGIAEDVNGKIYQLYDANKLYEITRKNMIDKACEWLSSKYENGFVMLTENTIKNFRKAMEE